MTARAARVSKLDQYKGTVLETFNPDGSVVEEYHISVKDVAQIYVSPHPYHAAFEEEVLLRRYDEAKHPTAGLRLKVVDSRLILETIDASTPCARIPRWRSRLKRAWLIKVGPSPVTTVAEVQQAFRSWLAQDSTRQ